MVLSNWKMSFLEHEDIECTAPCSMYSVLLENKLIPDPFYGTNEYEACRLSEEDCDFYTEFTVSEEDLRKEHKEIIFFGLDTICEIKLNGKLLANVINMHRTYEYDVASFLKVGTNVLSLHFSSPIKYFEKMDNRHYLFTPGDTIAGAAHLRKSFCMSGWDWGPKLPDMGIFRPIELRCYDGDLFADVEIRQEHKDGKVKLNLKAETKHSLAGAEITVSVDGKTVKLEDGVGDAVIESPKLWWPRGYGEQNLYEVKFTLVKDGVVLDECTKNIGLRTLTLSTARDSEGSEFCFVANGVKIFAMGANYIPLDSLTARITNDRLERIIEDCCFANFNCLRVWGGAYYPEDYFYELCDKAGIVIWQDIMIACMNVWMRSEFEREITLEVIDNVKRIRHHACIGLICGNNEMEDAVCNWGLPDNMKVKVDYLKLYEDIFPELIDKHAPDIFYLSSSPTSGGGFDKPQDPSRGDVHFWAVWNNGKPFDEYRKYRFRFCSEYGFESMPSIKTIDSFCPPEERNLLSYTMESHQKHRGGNVKFLNYLAAMYQLPSTMEGLVYATQMNQANAIKFGVEHFRRTRGYCMGSVYWQLNDCWPVSSWSSIDYYGRYKALHYFAKKFYAPVAMGIFAEGNKAVINIANEKMTDFNGTVKVGIMKNDFTPVFAQSYDVKVSALSSFDAVTCDFTSVKNSRDSYFFADLYDAEGNFIMRQTELGIAPKHFKWIRPEISVKAESKNGGIVLKVLSNVFAKNVAISFKGCDPILSDNFFDIATKEPVSIFVKTDLSADELLADMEYRSVYDIPGK